MKNGAKVRKKTLGPLFYVRRLNKAGGSRYLSVGKILPLDWDAVKVYVFDSPDGGILLKLIPIK